jgi:hypothetical protein
MRPAKLQPLPGAGPNRCPPLLHPWRRGRFRTNRLGVSRAATPGPPVGDHDAKPCAAKRIAAAWRSRRGPASGFKRGPIGVDGSSARCASREKHGDSCVATDREPATAEAGASIAKDQSARVPAAGRQPPAVSPRSRQSTVRSGGQSSVASTIGGCGPASASSGQEVRRAERQASL